MKTHRAAIYIFPTVLAGFLLLFGCSSIDTSGQTDTFETSNKNPKLDIKYVIPQHSSLHLSESKELDHLLFFDGRINVRARYEFLYEKDSEKTSNPFLTIYPDEHSIAQLPYLPDSGDEGHPKAIYIQNTNDVARLMFDKGYVSKLENGVFPVVSGEATFTIEGYWMGYECDSPAFAAKIISIKNIDKNSDNENRNLHQGGC